MIEQMQASSSLSSLAQELAEATSTRKMIEQMQASSSLSSLAQELAGGDLGSATVRTSSGTPPGCCPCRCVSARSIGTPAVIDLRSHRSDV